VTHSGTPSVLSPESSLPGVLAGWGVAGDCLSARTVSSEGPGVVAVALGSGPGFAREGAVLLRAAGGGAASPGAGGPAEAGELETPPLDWSWRAGERETERHSGLILRLDCEEIQYTSDTCQEPQTHERTHTCVGG